VAPDFVCTWHFVRLCFSKNFQGKPPCQRTQGDRRKGGTMSQLQSQLGHRGIDMTMHMYGSIVPKKVEKTTPYDF
jgi:hypothetical protein